MSCLHEPYLKQKYGIEVKWRNHLAVAEEKTFPFVQDAYRSELSEFLRKAKPEWTGTELGAVFHKLARIQIRRLEELMPALFAEEGNRDPPYSLNERLRAAGAKPFSNATIEAFKSQFFLRSGKSTKDDEYGNATSSLAAWERTIASGLFSKVSCSESPDWNASAPGGWWRVVCLPSHWCWDAPNYLDGAKNAVHCTGKILAMRQVKSDAFLGDAFWFNLRDEIDQWMPDHTMYASTPDADNRSGVHLELVCTNRPPSLEDRRSHELSVEAFRRAMQVLPQKKFYSETGVQEGDQETIFQHLRACYACTNSLGLSTQTCARPDLLPAAFLGSELYETAGKLMREGYVIIDDFLSAKQTAEFVAQAAAMYEQGQYQKADAHQLTSGQRGDLVVWLDHLSTEMFWPAISRNIKVLKAIAHALNPAISQHHVRKANEGDVMHTSRLVPPACRGAVLTVPPRAMLATYPGGGAAYTPHTDNYFLKEKGGRANGRELTAIIYANPPDWDLEKDGGGLRLYLGSQGLPTCPKLQTANTEIVSPVGGRLVIFFSELWHEVMPCERVRRALTLWILRPTDEVAHEITVRPDVKM
mmetsp:Transcript_51124/g.91016  ORF Transcript_51124/g.91016 Transcript_51124/m.91016 type:complete len:586 (+) Transcript_51124:51-1808(+)